LRQCEGRPVFLVFLHCSVNYFATGVPFASPGRQAPDAPDNRLAEIPAPEAAGLDLGISPIPTGNFTTRLRFSGEKTCAFRECRRPKKAAVSTMRSPDAGNLRSFHRFIAFSPLVRLLYGFKTTGIRRGPAVGPTERPP
jgi:hypothetical protein